MSPLDVLTAQSGPMQAWLAWMFLLNFSSVFFLRHMQARWAAAAMACNVICMQVLLRLYGTGRHLALPHVLFWSPLLVYFFLQRRHILKRTPFGIWACLMFLTDGVSLVLDYRAVYTWLAA